MGALKSHKKEIFCNEYVKNGGNASKAVIAAGYSKHRPEMQGYRLLKNVEVLARIAELRVPLEVRMDITKDKVVGRLMQIAFTDLRDFYDEGGTLKPVHELSDDAAAAIIGLETESIKFDGTEVAQLKKIKRNDQIKALELISKIMGYQAPETKNINLTKPTVIDWT